MPIRDVLVSTVIFGSLPFCFLRPWVGVLVWSWVGYMNPHRLTWSFAHDMPFAQMVAIATLCGLILTKEKYPLPAVREVYLLVVFSLTIFLSTLFAYYPEAAWEQFDKVWKILLMTFVTMVLFQDPKKVRALVWVIALSIGFYGLKGGIYVVRSGGAYHVLGPEGSFIEGNTEIGMALNMVLPFLILLRREARSPWLRHFLSIVFGFSIVAILGTYSRGAFLGLLVVMTLLFLKSRAKLLAAVLLAIAIPLGMSTLPEKWFGRMETIQTYEKDRSAMGRVEAWGVAYQMGKDRPLLGFGFRPFTQAMFSRYGYSRGRDAHSIFFQVLAEHGFTGLILYAGLIVSSFLTLRRLKRVSRTDPSLQWLYNYSQMLQASFAAYVVCGAFLSMSYFDLFYHLVAIVIILKKLVLVHEQESAKTQARAMVQPALTPATIR
jgi:probable O-glycosylation ligase (exosortase A-associated)